MNDEIKKAWELFLKSVKKSSEAQKLIKKISSGSVSYQEAQKYSSLLSELLVNSTSEVFPNDSEQVLNALRNTQFCQNYFRQVDSYLNDVQKAINIENDINLNPVKPIVPKQLLDQSVRSSDDYISDIRNFANKVELSSNKHVDTYQQKNAKFQSDAGYGVTVSRTYDGRGLSDGRTCKFCMERVGSKIPYSQAVKKGMFQRHEGCHCVIEYNNNGEKSYQISKGGINSWKLNEKLSQPYKKIVRTEKENISISSRSIRTTINSRKIESYNGIYISDNATIKPRALHELNKYNNTLVEKYGIQEKPIILIVSNEELNYRVSGLYSPIKNIVIYPPDVTKETQRHEMKHCQQADAYKKNGRIISESSYNEYIDEISTMSKNHLNSLGINEENVSELSKYAKDMFELGRFDEVEAEYEALKGDS